MIATVAARLDPQQKLYEEAHDTMAWLLATGTNDYFAELYPVLADQMRQRAARLDTRIADLRDYRDAE